ncbi:MAG: hypothetical protein ACE5GZ_01780 [Gammaproteobacteria bacterium]
MPLHKLYEHRKLKRYTVRLKVFDQKTGKLLGYAENLHTEGMKLMSKDPIPEKKEIQIWFGSNPEDDDKEKRISLTVYRIWSSFTDAVPRFYYSGLHFVDPSIEIQDNIQALVNDLQGT